MTCAILTSNSEAYLFFVELEMPLTIYEMSVCFRTENCSEKHSVLCHIVQYTHILKYSQSFHFFSRKVTERRTYMKRTIHITYSIINEY